MVTNDGEESGGIMKSLLKKDFRRLMVGKLISLFGSNMLQFALSLYVLAESKSATIFASVLALSIVPRLVLSPLAGVVGDWFDRKKTIVRLDLLNGFLMLAFGAYFLWSGHLSLGLIYGLVIILEVTEIFFGAAMAAVVPSMLDQDELLDANRVKSIVTQVGVMLAPIIGGGLYLALGLGILLILDGVSFLVSAFLEALIHIPKTHKKPQKINFSNFKEDYIGGLKLIKDHNFLRLLIGFGVFLNFSIAPLFSVGLVYVIMTVLEATAFEYGLIITVVSLSSFVGPILLPMVMKRTTVGPLIIKSFSCVTVMVLMMAILLVPRVLDKMEGNVIPLIIIGAISFVISVFASMINIAVGTLFDQIVPLEYMGRTASTMNLGMMLAMPLGQLLFGIGLDVMPIALVTFVVAGLIAATLIVFRKPFYNLKDLSYTETSPSQGGLLS